MNGKNDIVYIKHVMDSIGAINDFSRGISKRELKTNRMKRSAIVREIEIIGEAVKNVSSATKNRYRHIRWKEIAGTRDKMIHHYFGVDLDIVMSIVTNDIPILEKEMLKILKDMEKY
ncbi:MAG: DUF86 domain-containing protein [Candidatus Aenigmarchaeota archaeon]|nr:DUF86 domain-containing protein [Candidatus Aenigmarchaeota archaeon]